MSTLKGFEKSVINLLSAGVLTTPQVDELCANGKLIDLDFTGCGYFLTLGSNNLPVERAVLAKPLVHGKVGDLLTGFIAFVENREFILECYSYGENIVPDNYRDLEVTIFV